MNVAADAMTNGAVLTDAEIVAKILVVDREEDVEDDREEVYQKRGDFIQYKQETYVVHLLAVFLTVS